MVTPELEKIQALATRTLREQLVPGYFRDHTPDPFHFSRGQSLSAVPVVRSALDCLGLLASLDYPQLESVFLSAYWGDAAEQQRRAELTLELRRHIAFEFDLFDLLRILRKQLSGKPALAAPDRQLLEKLSSLQDIRQSSRQAQNIATWRDTFTRSLQLLGWPGENPESTEFQALQAWDRCLEAWVRLDLVGQPLTPGQALASLASHCLETQFQAQTHADAPVQVMGVLETAGLKFDSVWLADFDEAAWPGTTQINPFIPVATQIEHGIPEAIPSLQHQLATNRTQQLCQLASEVNLSHARILDDIERDISQVFPAVDSASTQALAPIFDLDQRILEATPALETLADDLGLPYTLAEARGGTGLIQYQSACPFSAYARYRLDATEDERPGIGMDNMQRGNLLHRTLESIWKELENSGTLHQLAEQGTLEEVVRRHAADQVGYYARNSGLGDGYQAAELARLTALISEWLELELKRPTFRVVATEHEIDFRAAELSLRIKIDRIDEIALSGQTQPETRLILDYKSGRCQLKHWANDRPAQPQVPLYYLAMETEQSVETGALAFAQVRQREPAFIGISRFDDMLPGVDSLDALKGNNALKRTYSSWGELAAGWRRRIDALAEEFRQGVATVDPGPGACDWCQFTALCRIHTRANREDLHDPD